MYFKPRIDIINTTLEDLAYLLQLKSTDKSICITSLHGTAVSSITSVINNTPALSEYKYITFVPIIVPLQNVAETAQLIDKTIAEHPNAEVYSLLSTALTLPRSMLKITKIHDEYIIFYKQFGVNTSSTDKTLFYHRCLLAITLLEYPDDAALVASITKALQDKTYYELSSEDMEVINKYKELIQQHEVMVNIEKHFKATLFKPVNYSVLIRNKVQEVNRFLESIARITADIKELQRKEFYSQAGIESNKSEELMQYIKDIGHRYILKSNAESNILYLAISSILRLPREADDYINNMVKPNHALAPHPKLRKLFTDVYEGNLRVPIAATISIEARRDNEIRIFGGTSRLDGAYNVTHLINQHIYEYDCFTEAKSKAYEYYRDNDYVGMFEQLLEAVGSINVYDNAVMNRCIAQLLHDLHTPSVNIQQRTDTGWVTKTLNQYFEEVINDETDKATAE